MNTKIYESSITPTKNKVNNLLNIPESNKLELSCISKFYFYSYFQLLAKKLISKAS